MFLINETSRIASSKLYKIRYKALLYARLSNPNEYYTVVFGSWGLVNLRLSEASHYCVYNMEICRKKKIKVKSFLLPLFSSE